MTDEPFTLITESGAHAIRARVAPVVRITPDALASTLGARIESQGVCVGDLCFPVRDDRELATADGIDLARVADILGRPLAVDLDERVAVVGASPDERARRLESLDAPDFTLPDLTGAPRSLRDFRGRKVFLLAFSSW